MEEFTIKNWRKYQHYTDRNPPWIKLHFEILSSEDWVMLADASRVLMIACMLVGSRKAGKIPNNQDYFKRLCHLKSVDFKPLIDIGFLECDSTCKQMQAEFRPETEAYKEEKEKKTKPTFVLPPSIRPEIWKAFEEHRIKKHAPMTDRARKLMVEACEKIGGDPNELLDHAILSGWKKVFPIAQNVGTSQQVPTPKRKVIPGKCYCGKLGTTKLGGEWMCDECITKG